jgi:hypothetical protein
MAEYAPKVPQPQATATPAASQVMPAQELLKQDRDKEAVQGLSIQCKLTIGAVDGPLESEADAMADKVMRMPESPFSRRRRDGGEAIQRRPLAASITPFIQAKNKDITTTASESIQRDGDESVPQTTAPATASENDAFVRIELPSPLILEVNGIGVRYPPRLIQGANGNVIDIAPYFGSKAIDFPLAALEALGIPILSYFAFHGGPLTPYRGMRFSHAYGLSGGTSFIRNALHYGYLQSDETDLYGAPGSFLPSAYRAVPNILVHANPMDIGTMINVDYFNSPLEGQPNNPAVMFTLTSSFDSNPLDAIANIAGAINHMVHGRLYSEPGVTHNYPGFDSRPQ